MLPDSTMSPPMAVLTIEGSIFENRQKRPDVRVVVNDGGHRDLHEENDRGHPQPRGQNAKEPEPQQRQRKRRAGRSDHERVPFESPVPPVEPG